MSASPSATQTPVLQARGLVKTYGKVVGLDGVDVDLYPGEVLAVIGDNGAGKSTLIKALTGAVVPDAGELRLDGKVVEFKRPQDAREAGIETVYQTLAVAPAWTSPPTCTWAGRNGARGCWGRCSGCWTRRG